MPLCSKGKTNKQTKKINNGKTVLAISQLVMLNIFGTGTGPYLREFHIRCFTIADFTLKKRNFFLKFLWSIYFKFWMAYCMIAGCMPKWT